MTKKTAKGILEQKDSNSWSGTDARQHFDDLLTAASSKGPQRIIDGGREFTITLTGATSTPAGNELLGKGGPIDGDR